MGSIGKYKRDEWRWKVETQLEHSERGGRGFRGKCVLNLGIEVHRGHEITRLQVQITPAHTAFNPKPKQFPPQRGLRRCSTYTLSLSSELLSALAGTSGGYDETDRLGPPSPLPAVPSLPPSPLRLTLT